MQARCFGIRGWKSEVTFIIRIPLCSSLGVPYLSLVFFFAIPIPINTSSIPKNYNSNLIVFSLDDSMKLHYGVVVGIP